MTPEEQKAFVRDLSKTISDSICEQIDQGKIPENWRVPELRLLLEHRHRECSGSMEQIKKRFHDVQNTIVVNNL